MIETEVDMPGLNEGKYAGELNFIVAKVKDEIGSERLFIATSGIDSSHPSILSALESRLFRKGIKVTTIECLGGGQIRINTWKKPKAIMVCGGSTTYGVEPDRSQTVQAIKSAFPEWEISNN